MMPRLLDVKMRSRRGAPSWRGRIVCVPEGGKASFG